MVVLLALFAASAGLQGCGGASAREGSERGAHHSTLDSVAARAAIAAGYRERARLGLGSPFRLIDFALLDPRLDSITRLRTARALLSRTRAGDVYRVSPSALDLVLLRRAGPQPGAGADHLDLIEEIIVEAPTPQAGEALVRAGYGLARLEHSLGGYAYKAVVQVAALIRDRELARRDARRLLSAARRAGVEPVRLVPAWRRRLRFAVERPPAYRADPSTAAWIAREAPVLLRRIRSVGIHAAQRTVSRRADPGASALTLDQARELLRAADRLDAPPQSALVMASHVVGKAFHIRGDSAWGGTRWREFRARARTEEHFVGEVRLALAAEPTSRQTAAALVTRAAVALRPFAQQRPWFPGFGGPSSVELNQRYGVRVEFAAGVPEGWRPFYREGLDASLGALKEVLPTLDLRGLRIRIPLVSHLDGALASHDPNDRELSWPALTGSGTLAHEIAHDLDWQAARRANHGRAYASTFSRSTDAARFRRALLRLTPAPGELEETLSPRERAHLRSAPEVLARNFEWFVLTELARNGRSNGFLSSGQDAILTGYGSLRPPKIEAEYGGAVATMLEELVRLPDSLARRFASSHGEGRVPTPGWILQGIAEAGERTPDSFPLLASARQPAYALAPLRRERSRLLSEVREWGRRPWFGSGERISRPLEEFVAVAAAAHGRGLVLRSAERHGDPRALAWLLREFFGPLFPAPRLETPPDPALPLLARGVDDLGRLSLASDRRGFCPGLDPEPCPNTGEAFWPGASREPGTGSCGPHSGAKEPWRRPCIDHGDGVHMNPFQEGSR